MVPVDSVMMSPNYWDECGVGAPHLFFALRGCRSPDPVRGFYNEFLRGDLEKHRKVLEVLASRTTCPPDDRQVAGVGFTAARGDSVKLAVDRQSVRSFWEVTF